MSGLKKVMFALFLFGFILSPVCSFADPQADQGLSAEEVVRIENEVLEIVKNALTESGLATFMEYHVYHYSEENKRAFKTLESLFFNFVWWEADSDEKLLALLNLLQHAEETAGPCGVLQAIVYLGEKSTRGAPIEKSHKREIDSALRAAGC